MLDLRYAAALALLALVPMSLYVLDRGQEVVALSAISVVLIAASIYLLLGPAEGGDHGAQA